MLIIDSIYPHFWQNYLFLGGLLLGIIALLFALYVWFSWMIFLEDAVGPLRQYRRESRMLLLCLINLVFKLNPAYGFTFVYSVENKYRFFDSWFLILFLSYMFIKITVITIQEARKGHWFRLLSKKQALERRVW